MPLQKYALIVDANAMPVFPKEVSEYPGSNRITIHTLLARFKDFYAIDPGMTGLSKCRDAITQIAIVRFYHFQPIEILTNYVRPWKGLNPKTV